MGGSGRFTVELAGLREVRLAEIEIVGGEQFTGLFADRSGENRRIDANEAAVVKELADRMFDFVAHARDRHLFARAKPEMAMLEQEGGAVFLW